MKRRVQPLSSRGLTAKMQGSYVTLTAAAVNPRTKGDRLQPC